MHARIVALVAILIGLSGCASGPPLSELRKDIKDVTFVQYGTKPAKLGLGVVDTASWWAANGSQVGMQTGGWVWHSIAAASESEVTSRAPTTTEIMKFLYDDHPIASDAVTAVMPDFGRAWGVPYDPAKLQVIDNLAPLTDADDYLVAFKPDTDLVLVAWMANLQVTEKITMGAAFKAGFTLGMHTKDVTAETILAFNAFRREADTGRHKRVWAYGCQLSNMDMDTTYPFPELVVSKEKAKSLWDEASPKLVDHCSQVLQHVATME